ncbi:NAD(P)/FAD-dependent oxidoreductase [bacterium]|nr:NAD(P)/FAD-dependent oxidoreductase [bacterium]
MPQVIVIGNGPAGVSASIYLKRANIDVLNISMNGSSLLKAKIENYYGYVDVDGKKLYENGIKQLNDLAVSTINGFVQKIEYLDNGKLRIFVSDKEYETDYLVLALGSPLKINSKYKDYLGRGVSICAHCDAPLYRGKEINVTGSEPYLSDMIKELSLYSDNICRIKEDDIQRLEGEFSLERIVYNDGTIKNINNLFLAIPVSGNRLYYELGLMVDDNGYIDVDEKYRSTIKNIYAVGDMISGIHQISSAVYSGMIAALDIVKGVRKSA